MKVFKKAKIYITTGLIAPFVTQCNLENTEAKTVKAKPKTESLAYLAYKNRKDADATNPEKYELPVLFGDEWAI